MLKKLCIINNYRGFSVVEVLLASTIFAMLATALIGAVIFGRESMATAGARGRAVLIAEEGLEAARNIRDSNFADLTETSDVVSPFTRHVAISTPSADRKQVVSTVTWQQTPSRTGTVALTTYLTNWRAPQSGGGGGASCSSFCAGIGYNAGTCRATVGACTQTETYEALGDSQCTGGPSEDTCCCTP